METLSIGKMIVTGRRIIILIRQVDGLFMNDMILFVNMMVLTIFCMNIGIW